MERRKLPTGIQTFREIRADDRYYVDKTAWIASMAEAGKHYFLSRPRRFGKSLLVDTLKELFEGSEELFRGLAIHARWDWTVRHPVIRVSFAAGSFNKPGQLAADFDDRLARLEEEAGLSPARTTPQGRLAHLIETLHRRTGRRVVLLVDEYDRPITDALDAPEVARDNRDFLRGVYAAIKDCDADVRFVFLTGVTRFAKVSLFSGLNNLYDLTLDPAYSAVCGYTEDDLDAVFAPELPGLDRERMRRWYNGYWWLGEHRVYCPHDILNLFRLRRFRAHWFETGTPSFLVAELLRQQICLPALEDAFATDDLLSAFDVGDMAVEALLFQTGYLTITAEEEEAYRLGFPNHEVRRGLSRSLLRAMVPEAAALAESSRLPKLLRSNDFDGMETVLKALFAGIPYQWHARNDIARYEGYYASVFYAAFAAAGLDVAVEDASSGGRLDMAVRSGGRVYLFEFKTTAAGSAASALAQIRERRYADKYRRPGQPVHLIGVAFDPQSRNIDAFEVQSA